MKPIPPVAPIEVTDLTFRSDSKTALVLLSGGLDSTTVLYGAIRDGYNVHAVSFDYRQRHRIELERAREIARDAGCISHHMINIDPGVFQGTALVGGEVAVPENRPIDHSIPVTYVPGRNILFLSYCLSLAESLHINTIFIGVNALDYSGYPDCRPEFIDAYQKMANLGTRQGVEGKGIEIKTPLIHLSKAEIIKLGIDLKVDYSKTLSCYQPDQSGNSCGVCDSCQLRRDGFAAAGIIDPGG